MVCHRVWIVISPRDSAKKSSLRCHLSTLNLIELRQEYFLVLSTRSLLRGRIKSAYSEFIHKYQNNDKEVLEVDINNDQVDENDEGDQQQQKSE